MLSRRGGAGRSVEEYYLQAGVRDRIREYCGLDGGSASRCVFIAAQDGRAADGSMWERAPFYAPREIDRLLDQGLDVSRSLWDTSRLLLHLDLDYLNPDRPAEAIAHPIETFHKLEPVYRVVRRVIDGFGLSTLDLMTGQGYHFTGAVPLEHEACRRLAAIAPGTPSWFASHRARAPGWAGAVIGEPHARASVGLGLILEHVAHEVLRRAASASEISVVLNATIVGAGPNGRESVSLDLSHLTYPLDVRHLRVAFGAYQKHSRGPQGSGPLIVAIPRGGAPLLTALKTSRDPARAALRAAKCVASLPDTAEGVLRLIDDYQSSPLARFHREFYEGGAEGTAAYGDEERIDRGSLPRCVASCLETPNDLLLRPEYIQNLTRVLLSRGWRASKVAVLIRELYERDFGWGDHWSRKHPAWRAEVYVRSFAGLIATGLDQMVDLNCVSTKEKGMCPGGFCGHNLLDERDRLLARGAS